MVQSNYLKSFKARHRAPSKCFESPPPTRAPLIASPVGDTAAEDVQRIYAARVQSDADESADFEAAGRPADDSFYLQPSHSECPTINECKMNAIFDTYLREQLGGGADDPQLLAVEQLLDADRQLEQRLLELRDKYKDACLELEAKKAVRRLRQVNRDLRKEPAVDLGDWLLHLPHPMDRLETRRYVDYLLETVLRDLHDINNVAMGELLDDDVITTVMEACQSKHADVLFVNPCITQCIQFSAVDEVRSFLDPLGAKRYANLFFVVNDTGNGSSRGTHWSLLLLNKPANAFCHYDSLKGMNDKVALELSKKLSDYFGTWQIVDVDCEQQTNNTDCGIYVLDNMLRIVLVLKNDVNVDDERITFTKIAKLPPSFTKTRIYMMNTYIGSILEKVKRTLRLQRRDV